ncbi:hypothetical protein KAR10_07360, partial [bacterium]|nr:hypothetical protein [bacterium]
MSVAGSIRKLTLDGVTFLMAGDADINTKFSDYESEVIATSGEGKRKMVKRPQIADGVDVTVNAAEKVLLIALANRTDSYTLAYNDASNDLYTSEGGISIDDSSSQDG